MVKSMEDALRAVVGKMETRFEIPTASFPEGKITKVELDWDKADRQGNPLHQTVIHMDLQVPVEVQQAHNLSVSRLSVSDRVYTRLDDEGKLDLSDNRQLGSYMSAAGINDGTSSLDDLVGKTISVDTSKDKNGYTRFSPHAPSAPPAA